jgi:hypothetical protein
MLEFPTTPRAAAAASAVPAEEPICETIMQAKLLRIDKKPGELFVHQKNKMSAATSRANLGL